MERYEPGLRYFPQSTIHHGVPTEFKIYIIYVQKTLETREKRIIIMTDHALVWKMNTSSMKVQAGAFPPRKAT